jgi:hypothetical protein
MCQICWGGGGRGRHDRECYFHRASSAKHGVVNRWLAPFCVFLCFLPTRDYFALASDNHLSPTLKTRLACVNAFFTSTSKYSRGNE